MISFIKGVLEVVDGTFVIVDVHGVGYGLLISEWDRSQLPELGEPVVFYTYLQVKEDGVQLFGFLNRAVQQTFQLLITVNGIGPKSALGLLSRLSISELYLAIQHEDVTAISRAPGVGKKMAQKLILELKDKLAQFVMDESEPMTEEVSNRRSLEADAVEALTTLGYGLTESRQLVAQVISSADTVEEVLKLALRVGGI